MPREQDEHYYRHKTGPQTEPFAEWFCTWSELRFTRDQEKETEADMNWHCDTGTVMASHQPYRRQWNVQAEMPS